MTEKEQTAREAELARREAALAAREAQLEQEQAKFEAARAEAPKGRKTLLNNNDPDFVNPKEKLYDKFPLTVHQMDIIIGVLFAVAVFLSFSTGTSWGTFAILVPIATGMFAAGTNLEMMIISVSAVLAGAVCGDHISPISDTTVMSSAGAQSNHLNHVSTQMQYAAVTACVCLVGYLIAAVTRTWWITLGVSLLLLLAVLTGMRRFCAKKAENGKK